MSSDSPFIRYSQWLFLLATALAVPILPLIILGLSFEEQIESWLAVSMSAARRFWLIVGLLSADLLLPVPSSAVSTYGGGRLGFWLAVLASWLGMTVGGVVGYAGGRWLGRPFVERMAKPDDLRAMREFIERRGALAVIITRPLPILAEACLLLVGLGRLGWGPFLAALMFANLVVSVVYAAFGAIFQTAGALPVAIIVSAVVPLLVALVVRWRLKRG